MAAAAITVGSTFLANSQQRQAASQAADAQMRAAEMQQAENERARRDARFRPIGVTNRFGTSNFSFDSEGRLTGGGYQLTPEMRAQQDRIMGMTTGLLSQYENAFAQSQPMGTAAEGMFTLGNKYLSTDPAEQARKYMTDMQSVVAAPRAQQLAQIRERLNATGRTGLAVGGDAGMMAANPEMAAYYNSIAQQDREMAERAAQGGMDYAKFGTSMVGLGGQTMQGMYGLQQAAYAPYSTALGGAGYLEEQGRGAFDLGMQMGTASQQGYNPSTALSQGVRNASEIMSKVKGPDWGAMAQGAAGQIGDWWKNRQTQQPQQPTSIWT